MESGARSGIASVSLADGPAMGRRRLDQTPLGTAEIDRPPLNDLPYRNFVAAVLAKQGFKLDFNRLEPDAALAMVSDQLLGPGTYVRERAALAEDIAMLANFMGGLVDARPSITIRTYFAPGDLVWHVDRVNERAAYRMVWPIGRPAGMRVTPCANIDIRMFRAFMHREHPLLARMDTRVMRTGAHIEELWAHRPAQLAAMRSGDFPFLIDRAQEFEITPGAASIHCIETPAQRGTYHRSCWANHLSPGFQIVITAASDAL